MQISKFPLWLCTLTVCGSMTLRADDTAAQAAARAALLQKMSELDSQPATAPTEAGSARTGSAAAATVSSGTGDTPAQAAARAALEQKLQELNAGGGSATATTATTAAGTTTTKAGAGASVAAPKLSTSEQLMIPPPAPVTMSKLDKLHWLNQLYKAGNLSPEQYQQQRAAIMAEQ